jgi:transposase
MSEQILLFKLPEHNLEPIYDEKKGKPRLVRACRNQYELRPGTLDDLIPKDHLARDIWRYVEGLDMSIALGKINAVEGNVGRSAIDPKILLSVWILATIKGINSARMIADYCIEYDSFKWICGGVNINHHTLSDFQNENGDQLVNLLIQSVALLSKNSIISLERVSQDGMRVRASAGSSSFRREATLQDHLILATELINRSS